MIVRKRRFNLYSFIRMFCMAGVGGDVPSGDANAGDAAGHTDEGAGQSSTLTAEQRAAIIAEYQASQKGQNEKDLAAHRERVIAEYKAEQEKLAGATSQVEQMASAMNFLRDEMPLLSEKLGAEFVAHMEKCPVPESDTQGRARYAQAHIVSGFLATLTDEGKAEMPIMTRKIIDKMSALKFDALMKDGELLSDGMAIYKEHEEAAATALQAQEKDNAIAKLATLTPAQRGKLPPHELSKIEAIERQQALIDKQKAIREKRKESK